MIAEWQIIDATSQGFDGKSKQGNTKGNTNSGGKLIMLCSLEHFCLKLANIQSRVLIKIDYIFVP